MAYTWQEHEPFHLRFCQGLYCKEIRNLLIGNVYIPNEYDEPGVLLFAGRNLTYSLDELILQTKVVADEVGQPACCYVTSTWENADLANAQLGEKGFSLEASISMYHKQLNPADAYEVPYEAKFVDQAPRSL